MAAWVLSTAGLFFIALLLLLILTQTVSIRITKKEAFVIDFNFIFIAFSIDTSKRENKPKDRERSPSFHAVFRALSFCLSRSHIELRAFNFPDLRRNDGAYLMNGILSISHSALLAYLLSISASYRFADPNESDTDIDATLYTPLIHLIISALLYFKERHRIKRKERSRP